MALKIRETDLLNSYKKATPEKRLSLMLEYYPDFPGMLHKIEKKTEYKIKTEQENIRSKRRAELDVRVQTSFISNPTANEAINNVTLEEAFKTGEIDMTLLKDMEKASEYAETIRMVSIMKMDYQLLVDILSEYGAEDSVIIQKHLAEGKSYNVIADEAKCSSDKIKRRFTRIREEITEEILECIEMNCAGGK